MRAVRLASATATTFAGFRASIPRTHSASFVARVRAAQMANHASTRTTQLYDRRADEVTLDEVERILV
jgi:hypothetical protein